MKKLIIGLALIGWLTACTSDSYKITGKFEGEASGQVFLRKLESNGVVTVDTAEIVNGTFTFKGKADTAQLYLVYYEQQQYPIVLFLDNSKISITANPEKLEDAVIKGSKLNDIFTKFKEGIPHQDKSEKMNQDFYRAQMSGDQETMESLMADMEKINKDQQDYVMNFVKTNSNNVVGAFLVLDMMGAFSSEELDEISENLNKHLKDHAYVKQFNERMEFVKLQKEMEARLELGKVAPVFSLNDINGNAVDLESFRGKYVFVDFWAGWCRPCREENPVLKTVYERFGGKDFEIVSVSLDRTEEDWKKAVKEDGLYWTLLHDPRGEIAQIYGVESIPNTWLLNPDGEIIHKQLRGHELMEVLEGILEEK